MTESDAIAQFCTSSDVDEVLTATDYPQPPWPLALLLCCRVLHDSDGTPASCFRDGSLPIRETMLHQVPKERTIRE